MTEPRPQPPLGAPVEDRGPAGRPTRALLAGRRVGLRALDPAHDIDALYRGSHGDPETESLWTYMPYGPFANQGVMRAWLDDCLASQDPEFRVVLGPGDEPVGMTSYLNLVPDQRRLELGHIWYVPAVQRTAVNTEVMYLMLVEAFEQRGHRRVEWKCNALNTRSRGAALRLGFRFEGIFRQHMIVKGHNRDTAWYAVVDADWPAVKANMERWLYGGEEGLSLTALNAPLVKGFHDPAESSAEGE